MTEGEGGSSFVRRWQLAAALKPGARDRSWKSRFGVDLPDSTWTLVSIEAGVVAMRQFETMLILGLLQTTDYTRALIEISDPGSVAPLEVERRVVARMTRQHILRRLDPPTFHVILDEAILRRTVGRASVMRDQLRKPADVATEPHRTLQILPLDSGGGPGLNGPFTLLTLPEPAPDVVYGEGGPGGMVFVEDRERVRMYTLRFGTLTQLALPQAESMR